VSGAGGLGLVEEHRHLVSEVRPHDRSEEIDPLDAMERADPAGGDRQLAEDLVAEAFTRAWLSWHSVSRHPAPPAWIVRTALNIRVSWWRRRRREVALVGGDDVADTTAGGFGLDPTLLTALRRLPLRQREVIVFRVFLDLDTRTTAKALGIASGTVTAHLSRAVTTLRAHLVTAENREVGL
jgi:RNA polymerase sigma factor (sigma-70 family)